MNSFFKLCPTENLRTQNQYRFDFQIKNQNQKSKQTETTQKKRDSWQRNFIEQQMHMIRGIYYS